MDKKRCHWPGNDPLYVEYHDNEWGVPVWDDQKQFENLILESFQAGLSWITILRKREHFRKAFDQFDDKKIAVYNEDKIQSLLTNEGIVRNQLKIRATVNNAIAFQQIQQEFGSFSQYIWGFVDGTPMINRWKSQDDVPAKTELSDKISKDLKKEVLNLLEARLCMRIYKPLALSMIISKFVFAVLLFKTKVKCIFLTQNRTYIQNETNKIFWLFGHRRHHFIRFPSVYQ